MVTQLKSRDLGYSRDLTSWVDELNQNQRKALELMTKSNKVLKKTLVYYFSKTDYQKQHYNDLYRL